MPTFEMTMLLKKVPVMKEVLRRSAQKIFDNGGVIRKIDNLGYMSCPYKMSAHSKTHRQAHYFIFTFDTSPKSIPKIKALIDEDEDVIREKIFYCNRTVGDLSESVVQECTIFEDLKDPPYRKDVQKILAVGERKKKPKFKYNDHLTYYPFQR